MSTQKYTALMTSQKDWGGVEVIWTVFKTKSQGGKKKIHRCIRRYLFKGV